MKAFILFPILAITFITSTASGADYLRDSAQVHELLNGSKLEGIYLRRNTPYTLNFQTDGTVVNQRSERGRWWVNQQGQYCRTWDTGRLKGNSSCMDLSLEGDQIAIYSREKRVAEGLLLRE
ncbi:MAG: hypothetical protein OQK78_11750 [Gammaproteobacteria bacterium]|nr:hypothetical protein [Gammaproteobacteria bacterium]